MSCSNDNPTSSAGVTSTDSHSAIVIGPFPPPIQGAAIITEKIISLLEHRNIETSRIDLSPGSAKGIKYHLTRLWRTLAAVSLIWSLRSQRKYLMSLDGGAGLIYNILIASVIRLKRKQLLLYHHSTSYIYSKRYLMGCLITIAGPTAVHVACSPQIHALLRENYGLGPSGIVVSNAAWIDEPPSLSFKPAKRIRLGHLGVLAEEKGLKRAIQTLGELRKRNIDAELALAGPLRDLASKRLLEQAKAEFGERVQHKGTLVGDAKIHFYGDLDYFLFPSLYQHETQSLVVPEALAVGTPVIAYNHRFVGEVLGTGGLLIPVSEPFSAAAADWISQGDSIARREFALAQSRALRSLAAGQTELILEWVLRH